MYNRKTIKELCTLCGSSYHYQTFCPYKKKKAIKKQGKQYDAWVFFRDSIAKPYLDNKYGRVCSVKWCTETENLDVDHIKNRGSNPKLRYDVKNMQYLCRPHHRQKTDNKDYT